MTLVTLTAGSRSLTLRGKQTTRPASKGGPRRRTEGATMPMTRPRHQEALIVARRQHIGAAEKSLVRIGNMADAGLRGLRDGQPVMHVARQIASDASDLIVQLAKMGLLDEFAGWLRRDAAA
jgi:hypothetical protein